MFARETRYEMRGVGGKSTKRTYCGENLIFISGWYERNKNRQGATTLVILRKQYNEISLSLSDGLPQTRYVVKTPRGNALTITGYDNVHTFALLYTTSVGLL